MWFACARARRLISGYIDGELAAGKGMLDAHLKTCAKCRREYGETLKTRGLFTSAPKFRAPDGLSARVMKNINNGRGAEPRKAWMPGQLLTGTLEAALILLVIAAGIISGNFLAADFFPIGSTNNAAAIEGRSPSETFLAYSVEVFDSAPPDSAGAAFLSTEDRNEK